MQGLKKKAENAYWYYGTYKSLVHSGDWALHAGRYWKRDMSNNEKVGAIFAAGQLMRMAGEKLVGLKSIPEPQQFFIVEPDGSIASLYNMRRLEMLLER